MSVTPLVYRILPLEILTKILSYLDQKTLLRIRLVSKYMSLIVYSSELWRNISFPFGCRLRLNDAILVGQILERIPRRQSIQKVDLRGCEYVTFEFISLLFQDHGKSLKDLNLSMCVSIKWPIAAKSGEISALLPSLPSLEFIDCSGCDQVRSEIFCWLMRQPRLQRAIFANCPCVGSGLDEKLLNDHIVTINVIEANFRRTGLSDSVIALICMKAPNLRRLLLPECYRVRDETVEKIAQLCPELEMLQLDSCLELTNRCLENLHLLRNLRYLSLRGCKSIEKAFIYMRIQNLPKLEHVLCPLGERISLPKDDQ